MEQVLPRQRTEGDDQTGRAANVSIPRILWFFGLQWISRSRFSGVNTDKNLPSLSCSSSFPEIRYFHDEDVRTKLTDILFCYGRENEQLLYKQVALSCLFHRSLVATLSSVCVGIQQAQSKELNTSVI